MPNSTLLPLTRYSLVFIDPAVNDYQNLIAGVKPETEAILLDATGDGVSQITAALAGRTGIKSIHIVSHGSPGSLQLGNTKLSLDTLALYRSRLQQWRDALTEDADLLLYGCHVAAGEQGATFVESLKSIISVEIAASTNFTGSATQGGNWLLEMKTGKISTPLVFRSEVMETYASVLAELPIAQCGCAACATGTASLQHLMDLMRSRRLLAQENSTIQALEVAPAALIDEDFSDASGTTPPPGWTNVVIAGNPATDQWRFDNPGERTDLTELFEEPLAVYDSDALSNDGIAENIAFESPVFDASDSTGVFLQFDQYYYGFAGGENASEIFVEAFNGTEWQVAYSSDNDGFLVNSPTVDLTDELAGVENAQIRFRFEGFWSYLWAIDNVEVVDYLPPGITLPTGLVGVSEDNVPDPLSFEFALQSRPTTDVTLSFSVDETQLQPIASLTFTPDNWYVPQVSVVRAVADGIAEGNEQTSPISVTVTSADSNYDGFTVDDITAQITDDAIPGFISYRTVEATYRDLSALAAANPNIASWVDIGDTYDKVTPGGSEGRDIYALELTNKNIDVPGDKPVLYVEGSIHAREYTTAELVTRFAEDLITGYGKNADTTWLLDYFDIRIVPILNSDGRKFAEQGYSWRKNTNPNPPPGYDPAPFPTYGVDLNRNFDSYWGQVPNDGGSSPDPTDLTYRGSAPFSEPETQAVRDYVTSIFPDQRGPNLFDRAPDDTTGVFLDIHSYGNLLLYPWGSTALPAANKKALETLGRKFGYFTGSVDTAYDVGPALNLYATDGTASDWAYDALGVAGYTFELGTDFFQDTETFENTIVPEVTPALFYAAKSAYRPYQTAAGPDSLEVAVDLSQVVAGTSSVILSAIANDTRYADGVVNPNDSPEEPVQNIAQARYTIDTPSWLAGVEFYSLEASDKAFDSPVETLTATIDTTNLTPGRHTIFVESQDANGNFGVPTAVFLDVLAAPSDDAIVLNGTNGSETLVGSSDSDIIYARNGNDTAAGGLGDDLMLGGAGEDILRGDRNTKSAGGSSGGNDIIYGGAGNDQLGGKGGNDQLYGEEGDDQLWGNQGNDLLWGGVGNDTLQGGKGKDTFVLAIGEGTDTITDFQSQDLLGLAGTLTFGQLSITQDGDNTLIGFDDESLAILSGVEANTLTDGVFTPITAVV